MIQFAAYPYLYLLLLVPLLPLLFGLRRYLRRRDVDKLGERALVVQMMPSVSGVKPWVRVVLFTLGFLFFVIGLARPQAGARLKQQESKGVEIMIALDVSNSMLAEDYSPNRLERAKLAIARLTDRLHGDRIGLVVFAGTSFVQLPITTDYVSAKMFLSSISTSSVPIQGTAIGDAIRLSVKSFSPQSEKSRAIVVITDGENHEDNPEEAARTAAQEGVRVFTIGIGSPEGKPIPYEGGMLKDKDGNIVVTRLDEKTLRDVAQAGGGVYVRAGNSEFGLQPIVDRIQSMDKEKFNSMVFSEYDELFMYFFAAALLLFTLSMLPGGRRNKRQLFD